MGTPHESASDRYSSGKYYADHPQWHQDDSANKVLDLVPGLRAVLERHAGDRLRIADVGAGAGGVLAGVMGLVRAERPGLIVEGVGFEIAPGAVEAARRFPEVEMRCKPFEAEDGPFDLVMFVDVLEHLENPWQMLRTARAAARFMVVRQPLEGSFGNFRHDAYRQIREHWGHIALFNQRQFLDMARASGWKPLRTKLVAPWELAGRDSPGPGLVRRILTAKWRELTAFLICGFYLNGVFEHA